MARPTAFKTRDLRRQLRRAGFYVARNLGQHEIWRNGAIWTRVAASHPEVDANELRRAHRAIEDVRRRGQGVSGA